MGEIEGLDTDEPLARRMQRHAYDRLIMLSDGVFAIAITLAALELKPPPDWNGDAAGLLQAMAPALTAYAITFLVIAAFWTGQRRILSQLVAVDAPVTSLFLIHLALIALQPAGVRLLIEHGSGDSAFRLYYGLILLSCAVQAAAWGYAAFIAHLTHPQIGTALKWLRLTQALVLPPLVAGAAIALSHAPAATGVALAAALVMALRLGQRWADRRLGASR